MVDCLRELCESPCREVTTTKRQCPLPFSGPILWFLQALCMSAEMLSKKQKMKIERKGRKGSQTKRLLPFLLSLSLSLSLSLTHTANSFSFIFIHTHTHTQSVVCLLYRQVLSAIFQNNFYPKFPLTPVPYLSLFVLLRLKLNKSRVACRVDITHSWHINHNNPYLQRAEERTL